MGGNFILPENKKGLVSPLYKKTPPFRQGNERGFFVNQELKIFLQKFNELILEILCWGI